ncbi:hypothetical protein GOBAR_DD29921 [Gossypium barbadense]|nr:hypothetical protein GOBAR_DD29921 [Gossypium barbadense]
MQEFGPGHGSSAHKGVGQALISSKDFVSGSGTNNLNSSKVYLIEGYRINSKCPSIQAITITHYNLTLEENSGTMVTLNGSILDPAKH